jgi:hypothetical protein
VIEAKPTDEIVSEMKGTLETVTARIEEQESRTRTEVRVIYETVRRQVSSSPNFPKGCGADDAGRMDDLERMEGTG